MGVPIMARPRQTATTETPARAPRKPAGKSRGNQPASGRQKARNRRESVSKTTGPTRPNPFDDIARQVNADQEARDRESGRDDLTPALAKSVDQAKAKRSAIKTARPTKVQANSNDAAFSGRPTTKVETVAARVKQLGLKVRATADVDALAVKLRATPDAVSAWLASRNGQQPAKVTKTTAKTTAKAPAKTTTAKTADKPKSDRAPSIKVGHAWEGPVPDGMPELNGATLVVRYEVRDDGTVWSALWGIRDPDGQHMTDGWMLPLDFRPKQEKAGGRKVVLTDRTKAGLQAWLDKNGLTNQQ
jgi:hypothetical protein